MSFDGMWKRILQREFSKPWAACRHPCFINIHLTFRFSCSQRVEALADSVKQGRSWSWENKDLLHSCYSLFHLISVDRNFFNHWSHLHVIGLIRYFHLKQMLCDPWIKYQSWGQLNEAVFINTGIFRLFVLTHLKRNKSSAICCSYSEHMLTAP